MWRRRALGAGLALTTGGTAYLLFEVYRRTPERKLRMSLGGPDGQTPVIHAQQSEHLKALVGPAIPLKYAGLPPPAEVDRPAHVRAGSAIQWLTPQRLAVFQDDANFVALVDPDDPGFGVGYLTLPPGPGGRRQFSKDQGNHRDKMDLESCVRVPQWAVADGSGPWLVAFGSGSGEGAARAQREHVVRLSGLSFNGATSQAVARVPQLFEALRSTPAFAGSELNVEAAVFLGDRVRFFNRGNGRVVPNAPQPTDAFCDIMWRDLEPHLAGRPGPLPKLTPRNVTQLDFGAAERVGAPPVKLTLTDAATFPGAVVRGPRDLPTHLVLLLAAEASPDTVNDGAVVASRWALMEMGRSLDQPPAALTVGRMVDVQGREVTLKAEGLVGHPRVTNAGFMVVDADNASVPCNLHRVEFQMPVR
jgi:hypothetical protein